MTILLKECRDVQLRCGSMDHNYINDSPTYSVVELSADSDAEKVISERLVNCVAFASSVCLGLFLQFNT